MNNAFYYNALSNECNGDYGKLKKLVVSSNEKEWETIYEEYRLKNPILHNPEKEWEKLEHSDIRLILLDEPDYPSLLKEIANPPFGIYVRGTLPQSEKIPVAVIGTRRATKEGKVIAHHFAQELTKSGCAIISGLAFGIDAAAHLGCLDEYGTTIAVLASGADIISPRTNKQLAKRILDNGGSIISEYPPGSEPIPYRFLERNRIVSGLSKAVLVIEAPESSGALATVRFASEQNRDVFIVPGSISHPNFAGSHHLIRNGAELVTKPEHIMEAYGIIQKDIFTEKISDCSPDEKIILQILHENSSGVDVDKITTMSRLETRTVNQILSFLLIKGIIKETESGYLFK